MAINADIQNTTGVRFRLKPGTVSREDFAIVEIRAGFTVLLASKIGARRTDDLRNNNTLGAIDNEGAGISHQGNITHENFGFLDFSRFFEAQTQGDFELA